MLIFNMLIKHEFLESSCREEIEIMQIWNDSEDQSEWTSNTAGKKDPKKPGSKSTQR